MSETQSTNSGTEVVPIEPTEPLVDAVTAVEHTAQERDPSLVAIDYSYDQVAAAFKDWKRPTERGGNIEVGKRTYHKPDSEVRHLDSPATMSSEPHRESSFNTEQKAIVATAFRCFRDLASGTIQPSTQSPEHIPPVQAASQRMIDNYRADPSQRGRYSEALGNTVFDLMEDYAEIYPHLLPAFRAGIEAGGGEGLGIVANRSRLMLYQALHGQLPAEPDIVQSPRDSFIGTHQDRAVKTSYKDPIVVQYEVWCSGRPIGLELLRQARAAARTLAEQPDIKDTYIWHEGDEFYDGGVSPQFHFSRRFTQKAEALWHTSRLKHDTEFKTLMAIRRSLEAHKGHKKKKRR